MSRKEKNKASKKKKINVGLVIIAILVIIIGALLIAKFVFHSESTEGIISLGSEEGREKEEEIKIYSGEDRPIAVMIDNVSGARPQAGLNDAYMVYEITVEGGLTRLMAVFKGVDLEKIGPVRSSRHYFLDYALENDAIYVHYGWSPQAQSDISTLKVNNINGITASSSQFWRVSDKSSPHNAVTSTKKLLEAAKSKDYRTTSQEKSILTYTAKEVNLDSEDAAVASTINIPYIATNVKYTYNAETKRYERYQDGKLQKDWVTSEVVSTKNVIITFARNVDLNDAENKGRQDLKNIGTLDGYYITNGKAIKITCTKNARTSKTVYKDLAGNEINVNDGNTFVQIVPIDADVTFE